MSNTHWRKIIESEYLAGSDLDDGNGKFKKVILTIKRAGNESILDTRTGQKESVLLVHFEEISKPMVMNVTNAKILSKLANSPYIESWPGLKIEVGTQKVKAFGDTWDALRISPKLPSPPKPVEVICHDCKKPAPPYQGIAGAVIADKYREVYGVPLCYDCGQARKAKPEEVTSDSDGQ